MSYWTNKYAIMRDLSKAQGRVVPVDINSAVGVAVAANEKPPQVATEETEEEFYSKYACGDVDYSRAPDFGLIQQMLEMVKGSNHSSGSSTDGDMIQISKINAKAKPQTVATQAKPKKSQSKLKTKAKSKKPVETLKPLQLELDRKMTSASDAPIKKKRQRNVAVTSLLAALEKENNEPLKLLTPTDFISTKAVTESVRKVDEWFVNKENAAMKNVPSLSSVSMFKKKSVSDKSGKLNGNEGKTQSPPSKSTTYKPSSKADEYYKKYLEKSQLNNCLKEDIWEKAERLMKEADTKRAAKAAQLFEESDKITEDILKESMEAGIRTEDESSTKSYYLTEPRHTSIEDDECIICSTVRKHGYNIVNVDPIEIFHGFKIVNEDPIENTHECKIVNEDPIENMHKQNLQNVGRIEDMHKHKIVNEDPIENVHEFEIVNEDPIDDTKSIKSYDTANEHPIEEDMIIMTPNTTSVGDCEFA